MLLCGLKKDGYLFLGPSENPLTIIDSLEVLNKKHKICRAKKDKQIVRLNPFTEPALVEMKSITDRLPASRIENKQNVLSEFVN